MARDSGPREDGRSRPTTPACDVAGDLLRLPEVLDSVGSGAQSPEGCSLDGQGRSPETAAQLGCPHHLMNRIARDGQSGFLKESPSESCRVAATRALKSSALEVEARLARHSLTSLAAPETFLEEACPQTVSTGTGRGFTRRQISEEDRKFLNAEYYLDMNRLKQAERSSYEMLASIDSLLGRKPLSDQRCGDSRLQELNSACLKLQACPAGHIDFSAVNRQEK